MIQGLRLTRPTVQSVARTVRELNMWMASATFIAMALALLFLGSHSLSHDEAFSVFAAKLGWADLWGLVTRSQANMSPYYFLLHLWVGVAGDSEVAVRLPSVIPAVATVPVFYLLCQRLFGSATAGFASILLSVNAFFITYAQAARAYSLVLLLVTISSYCFVRAIDEPARRWWVGYVIASALAVYAHLFAGFVPLAHLLSLPFLKTTPIPWRRLGVSLFVLGICVGPMALFALTPGHSNLIDWISRPSLKDLVGVFYYLAGRGGWVWLAYFLLCCLGLIPLVRRKGPASSPRKDWCYAFTLSWLFIPILLSFGFSLAIKPIFVAKYLIISLPPLVMLAAAGITTLRWQWLRFGILVLVSILAGRGLARYYGTEVQDWRGATTLVLGQTHASDGVIFCNSGRIGFEYYVDRFHAADRAPNPLYPGADWSSNFLLEPRGVPDLPTLLARLAVPEQARIWLILGGGDAALASSDCGPIKGALDRTYQPVESRRFARVRVLLYITQSRPSLTT